MLSGSLSDLFHGFLKRFQILPYETDLCGSGPGSTTLGVWGDVEWLNTPADRFMHAPQLAQQTLQRPEIVIPRLQGEVSEAVRKVDLFEKSVMGFFCHPLIEIYIRFYMFWNVSQNHLF